MRTFIRIGLIILLSIVLFFTSGERVNDTILSTLFTVSGIMFSIGMGLITAFNFNDVKNSEVAKKLKDGVNLLRNNYMAYFAVATFFYIAPYIAPLSLNLPDKISGIWILGFLKTPSIYLKCLSLVFWIFTIGYFTDNFLKIQKLKERIYEEINK